VSRDCIRKGDREIDSRTHLLDGALGHEGGVKVVLLQAHDETTENLLEGLRERAGLEHSILGTAHLKFRANTVSVDILRRCPSAWRGEFFPPQPPITKKSLKEDTQAKCDLSR
jgi:hypothetical protein